MDLGFPGTGLVRGLAEPQAEFDHRGAETRARPVGDEIILRRLSRERMLSRDRPSILEGSATPRSAG